MADEIRFCPNCGSTRVEPDLSNAAYTGEAGGNPNSWRCRNCDYTGLMPETGSEDSDLEEAEGIEYEPGENYSREDTGFGRAYYKYLIFLLAFLALIILAVYLL